MQLSILPPADTELVQIVDAAFADAARRSGSWLLCRPGCTQCCVGVFELNQLDAARLKQGMTELKKNNPERAKRVQARARNSWQRLKPNFPGDKQRGVLAEDDDSRVRFEDFGDDEVCPALDPITGTCDLYEYRPMTCRVFGPPIRSEDGLGVCELCFHGAAEEEIVACEIHVPVDLEEKINAQLGPEKTIVAACLK